MTLLDNHLHQMSLCAASMAELHFAPPNIFTNALLQNHDITTLIRDTEAHERALFSVPPPPVAPTHAEPPTSTNRRNTIFHPNGGPAATTSGGGANAVRAPRRNTAVAAVLGNDLVERIRRGGGGGAGSGLGYRTYHPTNKNTVDVDSLLQGAEKLLAVYQVPGAQDKIAAMRQRHVRLESSLQYYDTRLAEQTMQLNRLNRSRGDYLDDEDAGPEEDLPLQEFVLTPDDLRREEDEVRQLESKKRALEDRVHSMGRDISGLR